MIYLDNAATTKMSVEVRKAMSLNQEFAFANPGSIHSAGWDAKTAVERARIQIASLMHSSPQNIIFTSGGSESNSLALLGVADHLREAGRTHLLFSPLEHKSVLKCAEWLGLHGFDVEFLPTDHRGSIDPGDVETMIRENTGLVSVMCVNNETGVSNDIDEIADLCHDYGVLFHSDCVQALGKREVYGDHHCIDFISASAHKLHGPKGVGCLYVRDKSLLSPLILGGSQEYGLRAGTENVPGIVGFSKAAAEAKARMDHCAEHPPVGVQPLVDRVLGQLGGIAHKNGAADPNGYIVNMRFDGVSGESLVLLLSSRGVMVSAGSACTANSNEPSHVLKAMGLTDEEARSSIRISTSDQTTQSELEEASNYIVACVRELREIAGAGE